MAKYIVCDHCGYFEVLYAVWVKNPDILCPHCGNTHSLGGRNTHIKRDLRTGKPVDFWRKEGTPEAAMEHTAKCYESLEKQGKLKIPAEKRKGIPMGVCPDDEEFRKEYKEYQAGKDPTPPETESDK